MDEQHSSAAGEIADKLRAALRHRFGEAFSVDPELKGLDTLAAIAARRVQRRYLPRPIEPSLLRLLCACALSGPTKSDLQQAEYIAVAALQADALVTRGQDLARRQPDWFVWPSWRTCTFPPDRQNVPYPPARSFLHS